MFVFYILQQDCIMYRITYWLYVYISFYWCHYIFYVCVMSCVCDLCNKE